MNGNYELFDGNIYAGNKGTDTMYGYPLPSEYSRTEPFTGDNIIVHSSYEPEVILAGKQTP